jgi:hypothetical protein
MQGRTKVRPSLAATQGANLHGAPKCRCNNRKYGASTIMLVNSGFLMRKKFIVSAIWASTLKKVRQSRPRTKKNKEYKLSPNF